MEVVFSTEATSGWSSMGSANIRHFFPCSELCDQTIYLLSLPWHVDRHKCWQLCSVGCWKFTTLKRPPLFTTRGPWCKATCGSSTTAETLLTLVSTVNSVNKLMRTQYLDATAASLLQQNILRFEITVNQTITKQQLKAEKNWMCKLPNQRNTKALHSWHP